MQRKIVAKIGGIFAKIEEAKKLNAEAAEKLNALSASVLDKAMKGEIWIF